MKKLKIIKAKNSGYCFGVKRALNITEEILAENKNKNIRIFTLGSIIHNSGVVNELTRKGLISAEDPSEIVPGSIFIIRSHGMPPGLIKELEKRNITVVDATCPFVKKAQHRAKDLGSKKYFVVIIGNKNHPEVIGIKNNVKSGNYTVVENETDISDLGKKKKIGVVIQTTQTIEKLRSVTDKLLEKTRELLIFNTICSTTEKRQSSTRELSKNVDIMIVVGGKNSSNTRHLKEISEECNTVTHHIENHREIKSEWFKSAEKIGVCGGASTPEEDITNVINTIEKL